MAVSYRIQILKFIAEQRVVTLEQISKMFDLNLKTARVALSRYGVTSIRFNNIGNELWMIQDHSLMGIINFYYPGIPLFNLRPLCLDELFYNLQVTDIRILFEKNQQFKVKSWYSKDYIKSIALSVRQFPKFNIPAALFVLEFLNGEDKKFYLEYEWMPKHRESYKEVFSFYDSCQDIKDKQVIYVCKDNRIKNALRRIEKNDSKYVFYTEQELRQEYKCFYGAV